MMRIKQIPNKNRFNPESTGSSGFLNRDDVCGFGLEGH